MVPSFCACDMMAAGLFEASNAATALYKLRIKQNQIYNPYGFRKSWGWGKEERKKNHNSDDVEKNKQEL